MKSLENEINYSWFRIFHVYGPRQRQNTIIPSIIKQIMSSKNNTITLGNTFPTRDFNYVEDICDGFIATLNKKNIFGKIYNLGTGYEVSIKELVFLISSIPSIIFFSPLKSSCSVL